MRRLSVRRKLVLLAVALVVAIQLATLYPVLGLLERDSDARASRALTLGGIVLNEFMRSRNRQLLTAATIAAADYGFREAAASRHPETIRSVLANHAARLDADLGVLLDLDGNIIASTLADDSPLDGAPSDALGSSAAASTHSVVYVGARAYHAVSVVVRSPLPIARVLFGFEVGSDLAAYLRDLTGLQVTFLQVGDQAPTVTASTLADSALGRALLEIRELGRASLVSGGRSLDLEYLTSLHGFLEGSRELYVALQMPVSEARASYRDIRAILLAITAFALVAAFAGSIWAASTVARPLQRLAAAVRRMREGVYSETVEPETADEFGELADGFNEMQAAIAEREARISHAGSHDESTGLPNRQRVLSTLDSMILAGRTVDVVSLSIRRVNRLVASLGQQMSSRLMMRLAEVLRSSIDANHMLGYMQGYEFVLLFSDDGRDGVDQVLRGVARTLQRGVRVDSTNFSLQLCAGVASHPTHSSDAAALLYRAWIARVEAEVAHELFVTYANGQEEHALRQTRLIAEFPRAVENDELTLYYQPKVSCRSQHARGVEALVRWQHPELGLLSPYEFVPTLEQIGGIAALTRWSLRSAIAECRRWRDLGIAMKLAANISADDLLDENLPYYLLELTTEHAVRPADITLEVTESTIMQNLPKTLSVVACIRELGFRLAIDDFGTGHSSLAQLRRLPVDELKIDRSFMQDLDDPKREALVVAMIEMARSLSIATCVEGVEDAALLPRLRAMGAQYVQGFAICPPLPPAKFLRWYADWRAGVEPAGATRLTSRALK